MRMAGVNAAKDDVELINKQTKLLENRLEMSLIKLNEAVGKNKLLRDDIDNLRRERCVFDQARHHCGGRHRWCVEAPLLTASLLLCVAHPQVYKKLERELHEKKREMASVIDVSNIAYEARDQARVAGGGCRAALLASNLTNSLRATATQAQNEIAALRAQSDKEQAIFDAEYREVRAPPPRAPHASFNQRTRCAWRLSPLCAPPAAWAAHRGRPQSARAGAQSGGGEDLRVRAAGGREAQKGWELQLRATPERCAPAC